MPVVGGVRVARVSEGLRLMVGASDYLFTRPFLIQRDNERLAHDVQAFFGALCDALGYAQQVEPVPLPAGHGIWVVAVAEEVAPAFAAEVEAYRQSTSEVPPEIKDDGSECPGW